MFEGLGVLCVPARDHCVCQAPDAGRVNNSARPKLSTKSVDNSGDMMSTSAISARYNGSCHIMIKKQTLYIINIYKTVSYSVFLIDCIEVREVASVRFYSPLWLCV